MYRITYYIIFDINYYILNITYLGQTLIIQKKSIYKHIFYSEFLF